MKTSPTQSGAVGPSPQTTSVLSPQSDGIRTLSSRCAKRATGLVAMGLVTATAAASLAAMLPAAASAAASYGVMNAAGGIFWRSGPDWNDAIRTPNTGFWPGSVIVPTCYQGGAADVPGSTDGMWEQATVVSGPGVGGSGWVNEHFIDDNQPLNSASPGVPACGQQSTTPQTPTTNPQAPTVNPQGPTTNPQAPSSVTPSAPAPTAPEKAIAWALAHNSQDLDSGYCLRFVAAAYSAAGVNIGSTTIVNDTAALYWRVDPKGYAKNTNRSPAVGALVFWGATSANYAGHVGIYIGSNTVISTSSWGEPASSTLVHKFSFSGRNAAGYPYLGWMLP